jgi:hypothetical protein
VASVEQLKARFEPAGRFDKSLVTSSSSKESLAKLLEGELYRCENGVDLTEVKHINTRSASYEDRCFMHISLIARKGNNFIIGPHIIDRFFGAKLGTLARPDAMRFITESGFEWKLVELFEFKSGLYDPKSKLRGFSPFIDRVRDEDHLSSLLPAVIGELKRYPTRLSVKVPKTGDIGITFVGIKPQENTVLEHTPYRRVSYLQVRAA